MNVSNRSGFDKMNMLVNAMLKLFIFFYLQLKLSIEYSV